MRLIVNADDMGYSPARNSGMMEGVRKGVITSVSLMVTAEAVVEAVELLKGSPVSVGLHVNLSEGRPLLPSHTTLIDELGFFHNKVKIQNQVNTIDMNEVEVEVRAQVDRFHELTGYVPRHADGHQHVHVVPGIRDVFAAVMADYDIRRVRVSLDPSVPTCDWFTEDKHKFYAIVSEHARDSRAVFAKHGLRWPAFIGLTACDNRLTKESLQTSLYHVTKTGSGSEVSGQEYKAGDSAPDTPVSHGDGDVIPATNESPAPSPVLDNALDHHVIPPSEPTHITQLPPIIELMVHPGHATSDVTGGCGLGADTFSRSPDRGTELAFLCGEGFQQFVRHNDLTLCSFDAV